MFCHNKFDAVCMKAPFTIWQKNSPAPESKYVPTDMLLTTAGMTMHLEVMLGLVYAY